MIGIIKRVQNTNKRTHLENDDYLFVAVRQDGLDDPVWLAITDHEFAGLRRRADRNLEDVPANREKRTFLGRVLGLFR